MVEGRQQQPQWHSKVATVKPGPPTQYRRKRLASLNPETQCRTDKEQGKVQHCSIKEQRGLHILHRSTSGFELPHLVPRWPIQVTNSKDNSPLAHFVNNMSLQNFKVSSFYCSSVGTGSTWGMVISLEYSLNSTEVLNDNRSLTILNLQARIYWEITQKCTGLYDTRL